MNNELKWTPGPWSVDESSEPAKYAGLGDKCVRSKDGFIVALVMHEQPPIAMPNAHLIAAAPELYEALSNLLDFYEEHTSHYGYPRGGHDPVKEAAKSALAKACGEVML